MWLRVVDYVSFGDGAAWTRRYSRDSPAARRAGVAAGRRTRPRRAASRLPCQPRCLPGLPLAGGRLRFVGHVGTSLSESALAGLADRPGPTRPSGLPVHPRNWPQVPAVTEVGRPAVISLLIWRRVALS